MRRTTCTLVRNSRGGPRALGVSERDGGDPLEVAEVAALLAERSLLMRGLSDDRAALYEGSRNGRRALRRLAGRGSPLRCSYPVDALGRRILRGPRKFPRTGDTGLRVSPATERSRVGERGPSPAQAKLWAPRPGPELFERARAVRSTRRVVGQAPARRGSASRRCHEGDTSDGAAVNDAERVASYRRLMVGRGGTRRRS